MTFKQSVQQTNGLQSAYRPGIQALSKRDGNKVSCVNPRSLRGSVDLDAALKSAYPNTARWDYGIGLAGNGGTEKVVWVEVHPAKTSEVGALLKKLDWLQNWIANSAPNLRKLGGQQCCWVATDGVHILPNAPQGRRLAQAGLRFPVKQLELDRL